MNGSLALRAWLATALLLALVGCALVGCAPAASPPATAAQAPIELGVASESEPEPEPAVTAKRPVQCRENETGGCRDEAVAPARPAADLDESRRYDVLVGPQDPALGPANAPVRIVVFSDYQCPFCKQLDLILLELRARYGDQLQLVWKDLPLPMHAHARPAALLARNAFARGGNSKFWPVHDEIYRNQAILSEALPGIAARHGLGWPPDLSAEVDLDRCQREVQQLGINATPTAFVNGIPVIGSKPLANYAALIDAELAR